MAVPLGFLLVIVLKLTSSSMLINGQRVPATGYYPTDLLPSSTFYQSFRTLWGPQHQYVSPDRSSVTLWLDRSTGTHLSLCLCLCMCVFVPQPLALALPNGRLPMRVNFFVVYYAQQKLSTCLSR